MMFELEKELSWTEVQAGQIMIKLSHLWLDTILLFRKRPKWFPFNIFIHQILKSDRGDLHDHYWSYLTIVVKGGYWETRENGTFWRGPGYIGYRKGTDRHSLKIPKGKSAWTIIFVGPNKGSKKYTKLSKKALKKGYFMAKKPIFFNVFCNLRV